MSQIKLDPRTDLGLGDNSNMPSSNSAANVVLQPDPNATSLNPEGNSDLSGALAVDTQSQVNIPNENVQQSMPVASPVEKSPFNGISDMNGIASSSPVMAQSTPATTQVKKTESTGEHKSQMSNILLILAIALFVISFGALIFFALMYFKVI